MQSQRSSALSPPGSVSPIEMDEPQISRRHNTKTHTSGRSPSASNAILDNPEPNHSQSESNAFHVVGRDLQIPRPSRSGSVISLLTTFSDDEDDDAGLFRMTLLTGSGLNGRDSELSQLESAYRRVCDPHKGASEVVFVHGCTGTGKSALVQSLGNPILQVGDEEAYFVYGKFDVHNKNDPFSALTSAFSDICDLIMQSNDVTDMKKNIKDALGNDTQVMISLISTLSMLIGESDQHSNAIISDEELPRSPQDFTRLKLKFRAFLRAVATAEHPVILVLDDVHLATTAGVDIVNALLTDIRSMHVLIVVTYSDEFNENKTLQPLLCLQTDCILIGERHLTTTDIELGNLDLDAVNMIISDLTESNPEASLSLSEVVASKTHGNAFFVLQFLEMLVSRRLLSFSTQKGLWEWDVSKIQLETMVSDNVGELVASKIERLNQNVKEALQVASCFGSSFDVSLLRTVLASEIAFREGVEVPQGQLVKNGEGVLFKEGLDRILAIAVKERVIERGSGAHRYKFTHDKVRNSTKGFVQSINDYRQV
jgi:predicted ATPase